MTNLAQTTVQATIKAQVSFLFHMTHCKNLTSILERGLFPHGNQFQKLDISNQDVNARRAVLEPINRKPIHSYVPFYFNPRNAMLYKTTMDHGQSIIILGYDNSLLNDAIITDGNAANNCTLFGDLSLISKLDWQEIQSESWRFNQERKRKMMAEVLLPSPVATKHLKRIYCQTPSVKYAIMQYIDNYHSTLDIKVEVAPRFFF